MSMLTMQIDELRKAARNIQGNLGRCCYRRKDVNEMQQVSDMLREAADTIESLRDRLQADVLGSGTCNPEETEAITYYDEYGHDAVKVHVMECDECGGTYEHVYGDYEWCPRCGRKAVER